MPKFRGLEKRHEQQGQEIIRDTRTLAQRILDAIRNPLANALILLFVGGLIIVFPAFVDLGLLFAFTVFSICILQDSKLPFRMPKSSKRPDYNDLDPGSNKPRCCRYCVFW